MNTLKCASFATHTIWEVHNMAITQRHKTTIGLHNILFLNCYPIISLHNIYIQVCNLQMRLVAAASRGG